MAKEGFASLQILDSLDEVVKPEERTRKYVCEYYSVMAHPRSCFFCEHCTYIWYDYTVGPYMFDCDSDNVELDEHGARQVGDKVRLGLQGKCNDFIDDGGK